MARIQPERHVALFRGINVGTAKRVAMADLRTLFENLGFADAKTLLNSGNVVFSAPRSATSKAAGLIEAALLRERGIASRVTVLRAAEIAAIVAENPLSEIAHHDSLLLVTVLQDRADLEKLQPLLEREWMPEALSGGTRVVYVWCPGGQIESPVVKAVARVLGERATTRNWATIQKLHALTRD